MKKKQTKLNLIYGRSGTGKSHYMYEDIDKKMEKFKNVFVIVPEQSNLTSEKKFFEITGRKAMLNVEVLTLSRMVTRVFDEMEVVHQSLTKVGKSMLIYDILSKNKKALKFLGKSEKNVAIVDQMFTELKKHNVSVEDLRNLEVEDAYMHLKLNDILILYAQYEERLSEDLVDENDKLSILKEYISKSSFFENAAIYMDEFFGFTPQEYDIFEELLKRCDEMNVTVCLDQMETMKLKESDLFYFNRKYAKKLVEIAENQSCKIEFIQLDKPYRFKNDELLKLEKSLVESVPKQEKETQFIELFLANNPYTEVENVAKKIYELVKKEGYEYHEIGVIASDVESYSEDAKAIFQKYEIPIFIDEKKDLNQNILIQQVISLLTIFEENWSYDAVFNYLKIGLLDVEYEAICKLENYCKKWGIRGAKWQREFLYEPMNEVQESLEKIRKQIVEPLQEFKGFFMENKTVKELTKNIYDFLVKNHILDNLEKKLLEMNRVEISNEYNTSLKILIEVLDELTELFGEEKVTFEKYRDLLKIGIQVSRLGKIPVAQDQVILGDSDRTRSHQIKVLFVLGMNDGSFPKTSSQEGYLNDSDRVLLESKRN